MSTFSSPDDVPAATLVRSSNINDLDAAVAAGFALLPDEGRLAQGTVSYAVSTGAADAYVVALAQVPTSYSDGLLIEFKAVATNTGASTVNVNSLGVKSLTKQTGAALSAGDIPTGKIISARYNTTSGVFEVQHVVAGDVAASAASASAAASSANAASTSATNADTSATTAANYLTIGTSTSSVLIATGAKSFTATTGKAWGAGQFLSLTSAANSANYMHGTVTSYNSGTGALVMNILNIGGSGTLADWNIAISGSQGPPGATGAGLTPQTVGFTATAGTTPKTLTVDVDLTASAVATKTGFETLTNKTISGADNTLTADGTNAVGFRTIPQNSQSTAYTAVLADSGKHLLHPSADTTARTFTIPANASVAYPIGTALTFVNQASAGVMTIAITTDTMRLAGAGTTGSRTLAANGVATAIKLTATEWIINGTGLT